MDYIQDGDGCPLNFCPECGKKLEGTEAVSYTHLTLPTKLEV